MIYVCYNLGDGGGGVDGFIFLVFYLDIFRYIIIAPSVFIVENSNINHLKALSHAYRRTTSNYSKCF